MCFVVEYGQFVDLADDFTQVGVAVGGLPNRFGPERRQEIIAQVVVVERRLGHVTEINPVDVRQEPVAGGTHDAYIVLHVKGELKIVAPVASFMAVTGQHRVVEENFQAFEIGAQTIQYDDVRRNQQDVARQCGFGLVQLVEVTPGDQQRQHLGHGIR